MDSRVRQRIVDLVHAGVRRLAEMQRHVRHFVEHDLFADKQLPLQTDARYYPTATAVLNCIYRSTVNMRYCTVWFSFNNLFYQTFSYT